MNPADPLVIANLPLLLPLLHLLLVAGFSWSILLRDDLAPDARMAWIVVVLLVPYAGSLLYFLLGRISLGRRFAGRQQRVKDLVQAQLDHDGQARRVMGTPDDIGRLIGRRWQGAFRYAASINGFHAVAGNRGELMADGATARARMLADIEAACEQVHLLYYIWLDDETGTAMAQAVMRAARRGVVCRVMVDGLGSRAFLKSALWRQMGEAGVQRAVALPIDRPLHVMLTSRIDLRNHRKITLIDGRITYCGSQNCADEAFRIKARYAPWVDIMLRLQGPVVDQMQLLFASDWMQATGEVLAVFEWQGRGLRGSSFPVVQEAQGVCASGAVQQVAGGDAGAGPLDAGAQAPGQRERRGDLVAHHHAASVSTAADARRIPAGGGFPAQVVGDGPSERRRSAPQLMCTLIACARVRLTISTPYFVPDATVLEALCAAALRGVQVRLILPARNDSWIVAAASRSNYARLLSAGVLIHEFRSGLLHAKTLTVDGELTFMGSTNLDLRSFDLNFENNVLLQDEGVTAAVMARQDAYVAASWPVTLDEVRAWPVHRRIWNNVLATLGPVL